MLIDSTLREGAQLFGAYFTLDAREQIISSLLTLGVDEIEMGWVGQDDLAELIGRVAPKAGKTQLSVWCPCRESDIRTASRLSVDRVNIGVPVSDMHIEKRLGTNREGLLEKLASTVLTASLMNIPYISVGLEDISRADPGFALKAAQLAQEMGASRIRLSDSVGILTPLQMRELVTSFRENLTIELAVHCHDDFGMATGNAITALNSGADYADASILGIGERSGIAATEELAAYLSLKEKSHAYQTDGLRDLCTLVSTASGVPIPRTKAIAGTDIFSCESGLHAHALSKSPDLFEPYNPARIGANRQIAVGGKSGRSAIVSALDELGLQVPNQKITSLVSAVRKLSWELQRPLTTVEFSELTEDHTTNAERF